MPRTELQRRIVGAEAELVTLMRRRRRRLHDVARLLVALELAAAERPRARRRVTRVAVR